MIWSDDPHEDFVINCLAVLYDAAAKFTGGVVMGMYLLVVAAARLLWSATAGIVSQGGKDRSHVTREQASKDVDPAASELGVLNIQDGQQLVRLGRPALFLASQHMITRRVYEIPPGEKTMSS